MIIKPRRNSVVVSNFLLSNPSPAICNIDYDYQTARKLDHAKIDSRKIVFRKCYHRKITRAVFAPRALKSVSCVCCRLRTIPLTSECRYIANPAHLILPKVKVPGPVKKEGLFDLH